VEVLRRLWHRGGRLRIRWSRHRNRLRSTGPFLFLALAVPIWVVACRSPAPELIPDEYLQAELGLSPDERVLTINLIGGVDERAEPVSASIEPGDFVQFVSSDWLIHEVAFDIDSLTSAAQDFLERTGQTASPPLLQRGSRFVLSFANAPPGRYSYVLEGNARPGRGVIVVLDPAGG
jgi:plastocyanin